MKERERKQGTGAAEIIQEISGEQEPEGKGTKEIGSRGLRACWLREMREREK